MRCAGLRGLAALPRRMRTTDSRHDCPIAPDPIGRRFEAAAPNPVWLGDLTHMRTGEGWLVLAAVLDLHTRKIVGWSMSIAPGFAGTPLTAYRKPMEVLRWMTVSADVPPPVRGTLVCS